MSEPIRSFRWELSCNQDLPLRIGLMTGEASSWRVASRLLDEGEFQTPEEAEHHTGLTFRRFASIVEDLLYHPRQCGYAIAIVRRGAMPVEWAMGVVEHARATDVALAALELARCGAPGEWVRRMVTSHWTDADKGAHLVSMVEHGIMGMAECRSIVESMGHGSGRVAVELVARCGAPMGWALRVVLSDPDGRAENVERLRASAAPAASPRADVGISKTRARKLRRMLG